MTVAHVVSTFNWLYPLITDGDVDDGLTEAEMTSLVTLTRAVDTTRYILDADLVWHDTRGRIGSRLYQLLTAMQERGMPVICVGTIRHAAARNVFSRYIAVEGEEAKQRTIIQVVNEIRPDNVVFFCGTELSFRMIDDSPFLPADFVRSVEMENEPQNNQPTASTIIERVFCIALIGSMYP